MTQKELASLLAELASCEIVINKSKDDIEELLQRQEQQKARAGEIVRRIGEVACRAA